MNDLARSYCAIGAGVVIAFVLSYPLQGGLNSLSRRICYNNADRHIIKYKDPIFPGQIKEACIPNNVK